MRLTVNGETKNVPDAMTVSALLQREGELINHVLVEVNGEYFPARRCADKVLAEGDVVEIIRPAVGG
jgi:sulfur carrier protein